MRVDLFDFDLPDELIAQRPAVPRDSARLLDVAADGLHDRAVADLPGLLQPGDLLVFNDTKVIPARLIGTRPSGGKVEVLLIRERAESEWLCFARPTKRLKEGDALTFTGLGARVRAINDEGSIVLAFDRRGADFLAALESSGAVPLPPYIRGGVADPRDRADYQTMFAEIDGSVAAPTAGLHFTPELMQALAGAGVQSARVTLHVGAGTFQPVRTDNLAAHRMHSEWFEVGRAAVAAIERTRAAGGRIVAVGTTTLRALESAALGAPAGATLQPGSRETDIFITPGFEFRVVDLLITNFHLPRSTLMMLVSAFAGHREVMALYRHAIESRYRFFSYGDAMLLARPASE
jgi:S-adenosylmethionine:tRNA ribosyltransferase-isomerase